MPEPVPVVEPTRPALFADAERVRAEGADGLLARFVLLARLDILGRRYAMMAREEELTEATDGDLSVYLFELAYDESGERRLSIIDDDDTYAEVFHLFAALDEDEA